MDYTALITTVMLLMTGLVPWWIAGRYVIPARERLPLDELDLPTVIVTLRRGADAFVPEHFRQ